MSISCQYIVEKSPGCVLTIFWTSKIFLIAIIALLITIIWTKARYRLKKISISFFYFRIRISIFIWFHGSKKLIKKFTWLRSLRVEKP